MSVSRKKEDEASVGSAPLARQQSNQASEYASSPVKTKTVTGTCDHLIETSHSAFATSPGNMHPQLNSISCANTVERLSVLKKYSSRKLQLFKLTIIKLAVLKYMFNFLLSFI